MRGAGCTREGCWSRDCKDQEEGGGARAQPAAGGGARHVGAGHVGGGARPRDARTPVLRGRSQEIGPGGLWLAQGLTGPLPPRPADRGVGGWWLCGGLLPGTARPWLWSPAPQNTNPEVTLGVASCSPAAGRCRWCVWPAGSRGARPPLRCQTPAAWAPRGAACGPRAPQVPCGGPYGEWQDRTEASVPPGGLSSVTVKELQDSSESWLEHA